MKIIKSNDELMQFIPNVVTAVEGEKDLFTKIQTYIIMAESWLFRNVAKPSVFDNETAMVYAQSIVAAEAFRNAIPSLNVILTENGFGIVSNGSTCYDDVEIVVVGRHHVVHIFCRGDIYEVYSHIRLYCHRTGYQ